MEAKRGTHNPELLFSPFWNRHLNGQALTGQIKDVGAVGKGYHHTATGDVRAVFGIKGTCGNQKNKRQDMDNFELHCLMATGNCRMQHRLILFFKTKDTSKVASFPPPPPQSSLSQDPINLTRCTQVTSEVFCPLLL